MGGGETAGGRAGQETQMCIQQHPVLLSLSVFPRSLLLSSERTELALGLSAGIFSATGAGEAANSDLQVGGRFIGGEAVEGTKQEKKKS